MKKVIFGSALFIGGIIFLLILQMPYLKSPLGIFAAQGGWLWFFMNVIVFGIIIAGLVLGIKGVREKD
ncbi:MAG: hypothetical protein FWB88_04110 [Defluviitaleaceae bacterium]|nr:hypothetical protein [Defluviitaleaceae bacterium]MCL2238782.1 hypothetical protein [Defluviitaleaceae bacterium]